MTKRLQTPLLQVIFAVAVMGAAGLVSPVWAGGAAPSLLAAVFDDQVVLQRNEPIALWGTARPGATVTVAMAGATARAKANEQGHWTTQLPAMSAGGPHVLSVHSSEGRAQTVSDVLIGDVFLCSGQSNMVLPVRRALDAPSEIRRSANERIRMMQVEQSSRATPQDALPGVVEWEEARPATVPEWSAACYYFARALQRTVDVPMGLINSSWGGSDIRAWMSADALSRAGGYEEELSLLQQYAENEGAAQQAFGERWEEWWREATGDAAGREPWQAKTGAEWPRAPQGLGNWKDWDIAGMQSYNGMLWLRATADLTAAQAERDALLSLGSIDEVDQTWINGEVVGNTFGWGSERTYPIPAEQLKEGENTVVVNVLNTYGAGGMVGDSAQRALLFEGAGGANSRVSLEDWRYQRVADDVGLPPRAPWESVGGRTTIYNAMVAPLQDFNLKAVVWYQGESNTDEPGSYQTLLEELIRQWRAQFGENLPVLVVQLANYGPPPTEPVESSWAEVREAQRLATQGDPNAALAVAVDLGSAYDIHPANKQEVGRRLARAARHVVYGEEISPSGPVPRHARQQGEAVHVAFDDVSGSLVAYGHSAPIGFELCGRAEGSCQYADAQIEDNRVVLRAESVAEPVRVRYCWADSPICTLYDEAGLPAGPFEIDISN